MVEVTQIRRGAAWWVNGKETLKGGQPCRIPPACLSAQRNPENPGRWEKGALYPATRIVLEFLWGFRERPPHPRTRLPPHPLWFHSLPPLHSAPDKECQQKRPHNGGQQLSDALWGVQFAWGALSRTVKAGCIVMWRRWKETVGVSDWGAALETALSMQRKK